MHHRQPMGQGSIEKRGDRYRARKRVGGKKLTLGTYPTLAEAEAVIAALGEKLDQRRIGGPGTRSLRDWIEQWLEQRVTSGAVRDSEHDRGRLRAHVLTQPWADDPIRDIGQPLMRKWMKQLLATTGRRGSGRKGVVELTGKTLSRSTVLAVFTTLSVCFRDAVTEGLIDSNPCAGIKVPKATRTDASFVYMSAAEIDHVTSEPEILEINRIIYAVAIYTGLRKGELWGLRWGDVYADHASPHVMVRRSRTGPTKTGKHRCVPLLPLAQAALARARELAPSTTADALVFPVDASGAMRAQGNAAGWRERGRSLGGQRYRFHDLRHTCASHLRMGTWTEPMSLEDIQAWLGHSDIKMTQRYAHLAPDYLLRRGPKLAPQAPISDRARGVIVEFSGAFARASSDKGWPFLAEQCRELEFDWGQHGARLFDLAVEILRAARAGADVPRPAVELAAAVLDALAAPARKRAAP